MTTRVGINGFGRIGRQVLKAIRDYYPDTLSVVAFNDIGDLKTMAHLFKYDSNYGTFPGDVEVLEDGLKINGAGQLLAWYRYPQYSLKDLLSFRVLLQPAVFMRQQALKQAGDRSRPSSCKSGSVTPPRSGQHGRRVEVGRRAVGEQAGHAALLLALQVEQRVAGQEPLADTVLGVPGHDVPRTEASRTTGCTARQVRNSCSRVVWLSGLAASQSAGT